MARILCPGAPGGCFVMMAAGWREIKEHARPSETDWPSFGAVAEVGRGWRHPSGQLFGPWPVVSTRSSTYDGLSCDQRSTEWPSGQQTWPLGPAPRFVRGQGA